MYENDIDSTSQDSFQYVGPHSSYEDGFRDDYDEMPLLDELEIYPLQIVEKSLAVLNPFHVGHADEELMVADPDLAGPVVFCIGLAVALFLSGGESRFGYIYGLSLLAVFAMYFLMQLMTDSTTAATNTPHTRVSVTQVASMLGYGMLPIVWLSVLGIVMQLHSMVGFIMAAGAVALTTYGTSAQFCRLTGNPNQRLLLAYPCALIYLVFALVVVF